MIWHSVQAVFIIFLLIGAGVFVAWRKWVTPEIAGFFPKLLVNLAIPGMVIYNLYTGLSREQLFDAWLPLTILFIIMPISYLLGRLASRILHISKNRRGVFTVLFSFSNSVFIGFPVAQALFGDPGMPYAVYFFLANTTYFWILGHYAIRCDADAINGCDSRVSVWQTLRKLVTPPFIVILAMFFVIFMDIPLPDIAVTTAQHLGNLTTPLSLIFMGCTIYGAGVKSLKFEKDIAPVLFGRFLLLPALTFLACGLAALLLFPSGPTDEFILMRNVITVQAGLPVMTQTVIIAQLYGADTQYATRSFVWTTLLSLITIPFYMVMFQYI